MLGAHIVELGAEPVPVEINGGGSFEIVAVALNPLDLAVAAGRFAGGHPPLPYVPGCEAVGRRNGERVHLFGDGRGTVRDGFLVELVEFPEAHAVSCRMAWMMRLRLHVGSPAWQVGRRSRCERLCGRTTASSSSPRLAWWAP